MATTAKKFLNVEDELNRLFYERRPVIRGMMLGVLSRQNVFILGDPGSGKSELAHALCLRMGGANYFSWLISRTTTVDELFGPVSIRALEQDSYRRKTEGKLPQAHVAFLDEIFKGSSVLLNSLLPLMNERVFFNDGQAEASPLEFVIGASNELPTEKEELAPFYDRFTLRFRVSYIKAKFNFINLLAKRPDEDIEGATAVVTLKELHDAQQQILRVATKSVIHTVWELRELLAKERIVVSDRRWRRCLRVMQANAWLEERNFLERSDFRVLESCLWTDPAEYDTVVRVLSYIEEAIAREINEIRQEATQISAQIIGCGSGETGKATQLLIALKTVVNKARDLSARYRGNIRTDALEATRKLVEEIETMRTTAQEHYLKQSGEDEPVEEPQ